MNVLGKSGKNVADDRNSLLMNKGNTIGFAKFLNLNSDLAINSTSCKEFQ